MLRPAKAHKRITLQMDENRVMKKDAMAKTTQEFLKDNMELANKIINNANECVDTSKT